MELFRTTRRPYVMSWMKGADCCMSKEKSEVIARIASELPHLRRFARVLTGHRELADDVVQDTVERGLRKWSNWRRDGSIRSWLFGIEYRVFLDHCKYRARPAEVGVAQDVDEIPQDAAAFASAPAQVHHLTLSRVMAAVEHLPVQQRTVLSLVTLEGLSYDEVAKIVKVPIGTVRSRLFRARESLRAVCPAELELDRMDDQSRDEGGGADTPYLRRVK